MTTIAYRDGVLAADTQICAGNGRVGYAVKVRSLGPLLYGSSGSCGLGDAWEAWLRAGAKGAHPKMKDGESKAQGYLFMPDDTVVWFHEDGVTAMRAPYFAIGSGSDYALGAMALGHTAEEAVKAAMAHDTGTGGDVVSVRRSVPAAGL